MMVYLQSQNFLPHLSHMTVGRELLRRRVPHTITRGLATALPSTLLFSSEYATSVWFTLHSSHGYIVKFSRVISSTVKDARIWYIIIRIVVCSSDICQGPIEFPLKAGKIIQNIVDNFIWYLSNLHRRYIIPRTIWTSWIPKLSVHHRPKRRENVRERESASAGVGRGWRRRPSTNRHRRNMFLPLLLSGADDLRPLYAHLQSYWINNESVFPLRCRAKQPMFSRRKLCSHAMPVYGRR